jgi:hypothetical protein
MEKLRTEIKEKDHPLNLTTASSHLYRKFSREAEAQMTTAYNAKVSSITTDVRNVNKHNHSIAKAIRSMLPRIQSDCIDVSGPRNNSEDCIGRGGETRWNPGSSKGRMGVLQGIIAKTHAEIVE